MAKARSGAELDLAQVHSGDEAVTIRSAQSHHAADIDAVLLIRQVSSDTPCAVDINHPRKDPDGPHLSEPGQGNERTKPHDRSAHARRQAPRGMAGTIPGSPLPDQPGGHGRVPLGDGAVVRVQERSMRAFYPMRPVRPVLTVGADCL